jgi:ClpP class serine protease
VDGLAASIASVIAMAGDKVVMAPKASMMIHDGWSVSVGNAAEMRKIADLLDKQSEVIASVYADRSEQPADFWRDRMRDETWYTAQEAVDAGLADEVEGQEKRVDDQFDLSVFAHAGRGSAPDPVLTPELAPEPVIAKAEPIVEPVIEKEEEPAFVWDFKSFQSSLKEGLRG